jgi:hypothetical protein
MGPTVQGEFARLPRHKMAIYGSAEGLISSQDA